MSFIDYQCRVTAQLVQVLQSLPHTQQTIIRIGHHILTGSKTNNQVDVKQAN